MPAAPPERAPPGTPAPVLRVSHAAISERPDAPLAAAGDDVVPRGAAMATVIAAIDNSAAAQPVLAAAALLAGLVGADVEALHVREDGSKTAEAAARKAGVELRFAAGPVVESLIRAGREQGVAALVIGARGTPAGRRPAGTVALEVITALAVPVLVVPPQACLPGVLRRVLVPLNGTGETTAALRETIELACAGDLEVVLLHVHDSDSLPLFEDQAQHECSAWEAEFLARHAPSGPGSIRVETRVGPSPAQVAQAVEETGADLVALGWAQDLSGGRAAVVRHALDVSTVGVLLVPVVRQSVERRSGPDAPDGASRRAKSVESTI